MHKVFIGGLMMEANSFNPTPATRKTFSTWLEGAAVESFRGANHEIGGAYSVFDSAAGEVEVIPGFFAESCSGGPLEHTEFDAMAQQLLCSLEQAGSVDGVLLILHGAMQTTQLDDGEGYLLERVRGIVGEGAYVCASLDLHACITGRMVECLDGASGYQTYPHADHFETGRRAATSLLTLLRTGAKSFPVCRRIPMIMSVENSNTLDSPAVAAIEMLRRALGGGEILSGSLFFAQPWLDVPELGCSVLFFGTAPGSRQALEQEADAILDYIWRNRGQFYPPMPDVPQALSLCADMERPIVFVDFGDGPNAGGTGDSSHVLKGLLNAQLPFDSAVTMYDAQTLKAAYEVGEGNTGEFSIGGFGAPGDFNERIPVSAKVQRLCDQPFAHLGPVKKGLINNPGRRALLVAGNVHIIVCEQICLPHDQNMLITMGVQPEKMGLIAMRATHSFMDSYRSVMKSWLYVDTPGFTARNLTCLPYKKCARPIYPLDNI